jgi:hypothetical protein
MPDNLSPPSASGADPRPHQNGEARGTKSGMPVSVSVEWMVDTGAQISALRQATANHFDLTAVGGSASSTTGGGGMLIKSGLTTVFEVFDTAGAAVRSTCSRKVSVKSTNAGSNILGMDQVADVGAVVEWDPVAKTGRLREP